MGILYPIHRELAVVLFGLVGDVALRVLILQEHVAGVLLVPQNRPDGRIGEVLFGV